MVGRRLHELSGRVHRHTTHPTLRTITRIVELSVHYKLCKLREKSRVSRSQKQYNAAQTPGLPHNRLSHTRRM